MQTVNDLIFAGDDTVFEYIDLNSMIDWYIVNELFKNTDSHMQSSIYFYKDKGGKLYMGPVWDFDLSSGSQTGGDYKLDDPTGFWTRGTEYCGWFNALYEMDTFRNALYARWAELREEGIIDAVFTDMDTFVANNGKAAETNYNIWHENYVQVVGAETSSIIIPETAKTGSWADQVENLRSFLTARIAWLDEQFGYVPEVSDTEVSEAA